MLVVRNRDEPGTIGFIGSALGEADINIAGMFNGRETIGGEALSVYNLDEQPPNDVIEGLNDDSRIIETTYVELGDE
jgi:D-3-phosphoglycerate dehydrogenase